MKLPLKFAFRYLFSGKMSLVNIITLISVFGVAGMSAALIVILSVFNGFDSLIRSMINQFDPDIKITAKTGKTFMLSSSQLAQISEIEDVNVVSPTIEETALFEYRHYQYICTLKGVSENYDKICDIKNCTYAGDYVLRDTASGVPFAVVGCDIAGNLGLTLGSFPPIRIYAPNKNEKISVTNPYNAFTKTDITPIGIFHIHQDFDSKYVIAPIDFVRNILEYEPEEFSSVEISCRENASTNAVINKIEKLLGEDFLVKDRYQQQDTLYKVMQSEKLSIVVMLSFIIIIASFNIAGALSMLIIDKKNDIATLSHLGGDEKFIKNVFTSTGRLITLTGAVSGLVIGLIICWIQIEFQVLTFPSDGSFIIDYYPVEVRLTDIFISFFVVTVIGFLAAQVPVRKITG
ncbi:MAG: ABC transporter permease [Bacteroidales bacterium]|nr:ABC transporter permease [Bacteroidales bacterium]